MNTVGFRVTDDEKRALEMYAAKNSTKVAHMLREQCQEIINKAQEFMRKFDNKQEVK